MRCTSFLVLFCILKCADIVFATCTVTKYEEEGQGNRLQCSNVTMTSVSSQGTNDVTAIMIFKSDLQYILDRLFLRYANVLVSLTIRECKIKGIHREAFYGLKYLKKLALPGNNITKVEEEWFKDLTSLEELDLSYNSIDKIEPQTFNRLRNVKRLDVRENHLACLDPVALLPMGGIDKLHFSGNPLSFQCRGKLTLWLRDHGINYASDQSAKENWLNSLLWLCAINDAEVAESEILMKECVVLNLFNQLRTGLISAESYPLPVPEDCAYSRNLLINCIAKEAQSSNEIATNGRVIHSLLLQLREAKSVEKKPNSIE